MKALHLMAVLAVAAVLLIGGADTALAAKHAIPTWKVWWNWSWKIINFLVLAFLIYKVAKKPLKEFLTGARAKVADELEVVNKAKAEAEAQLKLIHEKTAGLAQELADYQETLGQFAERERQRMIDEAREASEMIMDRAKLQAEMALQHARQELTHEIVELAAELAESKLKEAVSPQDQDRFLDKFTAGALTARREAL
ncbi:MAG: ATP synthase F0 subunit B [Desulfarculus sp.]|nr:ATP synthase F0 subunit B [Pseudomonadota bacterium]MBV1714956.1 ATP synthase F0 subunit B [Desulfarculus sp.]MBU4575923.1 ATP synthase F0 subunit B [Pseudomonadota bacterium]MBU4598992.1 ATP synthase F0 subunit B [Pseudomonadota bacterium]MBV1737456.1 ATP synthase F0 subunit B [Desulfarculus sp.]